MARTLRFAADRAPQSRNACIHAAFAAWCGLLLALLAAPIHAAQVDIAGPLGSNAFGTTVTVLSNGNIVVTDPDFGLNAVGAVYLYSPAGVAISALTGSTKNDHVGSGGVVVLTNGNFVVLSPLWANSTSANAGAVTWIDGATGIPGNPAIVATDNSLVGSKSGDQVGSGGVVALGNGNFVVVSPNWDNGGTADVGAVTWASGSGGTVGGLAQANSLIGAKAGDHVGSGGVIALSNGNYVVSSPNWSSATVSSVGAVTWANGATGLSGTIDDLNSLVGSKANDHVGNGVVVALTGNGNYVVTSPNWTNGTHANAGAATWGSGVGGAKGAISNTNSLVGTSTSDQVGGDGVTPLTNGNYVVDSHMWGGGAGAATWGDGSTGTFGDVSIGNSLIGSVGTDAVGETGVTALTNGNYVVASRLWDNGGSANVGAVTWGSGAAGVSGQVSNANSLIGGSQGDRIGSGGVTALSNGNFVISSPLWDSVAAVDVGAVTWVDGAVGAHGTITAANSLTGSTTSDQVGSDGVTALGNGNYVVCSSLWDNNLDADVGAATWVDGSAGVSNVVVSTANSLVGTTPGDLVCSGHAVAIGTGNFVIDSPAWNSAVTTAGAVTWGYGDRVPAAAVSAANSLVGTTSADQVGSGGVTKLAGGDYVVRSPLWDNGATPDAGAISLGRSRGGSFGELLDTNSVLGTVATVGAGLVFAYDATRDTLVVGQPAANIVSLFKADLLFKNGFE